MTAVESEWARRCSAACFARGRHLDRCPQCAVSAAARTRNETCDCSAACRMIRRRRSCARHASIAIESEWARRCNAACFARGLPPDCSTHLANAAIMQSSTCAVVCWSACCRRARNAFRTAAAAIHPARLRASCRGAACTIALRISGCHSERARQTDIACTRMCGSMC
eukprot:3802190-Prymnesium_polylepis.4